MPRLISTSTATTSDVWSNWTTTTDTTTNSVSIPVRWTWQDPAPRPRQDRPPREWNEYLGASDVLERFVAWAQGHISEGEALQLPVELFVKWLILEAASDGEEADPVRIPKPRCVACGRFVPRSNPLPACSPGHAAVGFQRRLAA